MKKLHQEKEHQKTKRISYILSVLFILVAFLVIVQVYLANQLAETGEKIRKLNSQKESLVIENEKLAEKLAKDASFDKISEKAKKLGLIKITSVVYLKTSSLRKPLNE